GPSRGLARHAGTRQMEYRRDETFVDQVRAGFAKPARRADGVPPQSPCVTGRCVASIPGQKVTASLRLFPPRENPPPKQTRCLPKSANSEPRPHLCTGEGKTGRPFLAKVLSTQPPREHPSTPL